MKFVKSVSKNHRKYEFCQVFDFWEVTEIL